jgi:hypothetical protein
MGLDKLERSRRSRCCSARFCDGCTDAVALVGLPCQYNHAETRHGRGYLGVDVTTWGHGEAAVRLSGQQRGQQRGRIQRREHAPASRRSLCRAGQGDMIFSGAVALATVRW